jgi:hypothetical protein
MLSQPSPTMLYLAKWARDSDAFTRFHRSFLATPVCRGSDCRGDSRIGCNHSSRGGIVILVKISSGSSGSICSGSVGKGAPNRAMVHQCPQLEVMAAVGARKRCVHQVCMSVSISSPDDQLGTPFLRTVPVVLGRL